ncbi:MAG TPA: lysophospholipid acyltransferase family protein [Prolixibacteraceae bacterium]|nr:lysophospholipid acyltransferase family protein [Prolixibacteraceae bacterium]
MKKILAYILSSLYWSIFGILLVLFHPVQMLTEWIWGYRVRKKVVDIMNYGLLYSLWILGTKITFRGLEKIPQNRPLIIVSNHQTTIDIPAVVIGFKKNHPKFISKIELGKGIPSISYNLRHGGSVLIDRKNPRQSVKDILTLGKHIEEKNYAACIFPEGTRTKDGKLKPFMPAGIASLYKTAPSALIVPFAIDGNYELMKHGYFPMTLGVDLKLTVFDPIDPKGMDMTELARKIEDIIRKELGQ